MYIGMIYIRNKCGNCPQDVGSNSLSNDLLVHKMHEESNDV